MNSLKWPTAVWPADGATTLSVAGSAGWIWLFPVDVSHPPFSADSFEHFPDTLEFRHKIGLHVGWLGVFLSRKEEVSVQQLRLNPFCLNVTGATTMKKPPRAQNPDAENRTGRSVKVLCRFVFFLFFWPKILRRKLMLNNFPWILERSHCYSKRPHVISWNLGLNHVTWQKIPYNKTHLVSYHKRTIR